MTFTAYQIRLFQHQHTQTSILKDFTHKKNTFFVTLKPHFVFLQKKSFGAEHAAAKYVYFTSAVHFENCGFFFKRKILDI